MKLKKINKKTFSWQGIAYRIFVIGVNAIFFKVGAKQAMQQYGAIGASLIWNSINMILYFLYHGVFLRLFSLRIETNGTVIWFTGLSGSGKTTISDKLAQELLQRGYKVQKLDGDILRKTINKDLGFSLEDRKINLERAIAIAKILAENKIIVLCSFISPDRNIRNKFRKQIKNFIEIYVNCPLSICKQRDPKGLYRQACAGRISNFTGISQKYEPPLHPHIELKTDLESIENSTKKIMNYLRIQKLI